VLKPGTIAALAATCIRVADSLPVADIAEARVRATGALAELAEVGASRNQNFVTAANSLAVLLVNLTAVAGDLTAAAGHIRTFRERLG
jgi:hypothetical protein